MTRAKGNEASDTVPAVTADKVIRPALGGFAGLVPDRREGRVEVTEAMARGEVDTPTAVDTDAD